MLYMHIPKNAGTTIEGWLASMAPLHLSTDYNLGYSPSFRSTPQHFTADDIQRLFADSFLAILFYLLETPMIA